jgi:hypothetical protein
LAYWATFSQLQGCAVFVLSSFNQFGITDVDSAVYNIFVNGFNVCGWLGFALYGWFLMLEVQPFWWKFMPQLRVWKAQFANFTAGLTFSIATCMLMLPSSQCSSTCRMELYIGLSVIGSILYLVWGYLFFKEEQEKAIQEQNKSRDSNAI